ncbi:hypothetical protein [Bradyrhizobium genosp. P]|uniref:hypothetical protein n=1 Tax=Bradyrhizobium genosp. P TaxID=83641 RepID=UPI003CF453B6
MSFLEKIRDAAKQLDAPTPDPWRKPLESALKGVDAMSTVALLDLVGARHTTSNARRLAMIMRELKFIPIQSRRLLPGGFRDTVSRGWVRPMRPLPEGEKVEPRQGSTASPWHICTLGQGEKVRKT